MTRRERIELIIIATAAAATAVVAATGGMDAAGDERPRHNPLIRHLGNDDGFSGKWDGQWTASSTNEYDCTGSNCNDDDGRSEGWIDNVDPEALTPEQIITYVGLGILGFMTLLCLVCYPEIISVPCKSLRDWCFSHTSLVSGAMDVTGEGGGYVGGRAEAETPTRKKRKSRKGETSTSGGRLEPSKKDSELV